jgi:phosphoserine phosphatase RsbU/P
VWDSVLKVLSGPALARLVLAAVLLAAFLGLRKKDGEGAMLGFALLAGFLALRDLALAFLPSPALYAASDLLVFGSILLLALRPFRLGWFFWLVASLDSAAIAALVLEALGLGPGLPIEGLRLFALVPIVALALVPLLFRSESDTPARKLSLRSWLPLLLGSGAYVAAGFALGPDSGIFVILVVPAFYCLLLSLPFAFLEVLHEHLTGAVELYEESVDSLHDLLISTGKDAGRGTGLQKLLDDMIRNLVERCGAEGGILLLADGQGESVSVRALCGSYPPPFRLPDSLPRTPERVESFLRGASFRLGEGLLGEVSRTGTQVFIPRAGLGSQLPVNGDEAWLKSGALIASPLMVRDRIIGAVSVAKAGDGRFSLRDFERCKFLANFGSIAVANALSLLEAAERGDGEREDDLAARVQSDLAPASLPGLPGLAFGLFASRARGACSDYYDIITMRGGRAVVALGCAAGGGIAAALVLATLRSILRLLAASAGDGATLLRWANRGIVGGAGRATLCLAVLDYSSGAVELAIAGRQSALLCRGSDGSLETLEGGGAPLGLERGSAYASTRLVLGEGDVLVLYTEGIVETANPPGGQYGRGSLGAAVRASRGSGACRIAERTGAELLAFSGPGPSRGDRTILVMKRSTHDH